MHMQRKYGHGSSRASPRWTKTFAPSQLSACQKTIFYHDIVGFENKSRKGRTIPVAQWLERPPIE